MSHPINALSLIKRAVHGFPKLKVLLQEECNKNNNQHACLSPEFWGPFILEDPKNLLIGAALGLVNIQVFHNLNITQLIQGNYTY